MKSLKKHSLDKVSDIPVFSSDMNLWFMDFGCNLNIEPYSVYLCPISDLILLGRYRPFYVGYTEFNQFISELESGSILASLSILNLEENITVGDSSIIGEMLTYPYRYVGVNFVRSVLRYVEGHVDTEDFGSTMSLYSLRLSYHLLSICLLMSDNKLPGSGYYLRGDNFNKLSLESLITKVKNLTVDVKHFLDSGVYRDIDINFYNEKVKQVRDEQIRRYKHDRQKHIIQ